MVDDVTLRKVLVIYLIKPFRLIFEHSCRRVDFARLFILFCENNLMSETDVRRKLSHLLAMSFFVL